MKLFGRHKGGPGSGAVTAGELGHTQFGTPLEEVIGADPQEDPQKWLSIPTSWGDTAGRWEGPQEWADTMGALCWGAWAERTPDARPDPEGVERTKLELKTYAEKFGGFDPTQPFEVATYLYLPDPRRYSTPVHLWVDDRPGLTVEQGTSDEDAIEAPVVEEFSTDALGTGRKTTCHGTLDPQPGDLPGTQGVWATTRYAFAVPGRQAVVTIKATETDLARMNAATADLDEFVRSISLSLSDGTPVVVNGAGSASA